MRHTLAALALALAGCGHPPGPQADAGVADAGLADAGPADAGPGTGSLSGVWSFPVGSARLILPGGDLRSARVRLVDAPGVGDCGDTTGAMLDVLDLRVTPQAGPVAPGDYAVDGSDAFGTDAGVGVVRAKFVGHGHYAMPEAAAAGTVTLRAIDPAGATGTFVADFAPTDGGPPQRLSGSFDAPRCW